jgi:hypothetical protein
VIKPVDVRVDSSSILIKPTLLTLAALDDTTVDATSLAVLA